MVCVSGGEGLVGKMTRYHVDWKSKLQQFNTGKITATQAKENGNGRHSWEKLKGGKIMKWGIRY